jgi:hypothetical protein
MKYVAPVLVVLILTGYLVSVLLGVLASPLQGGVGLIMGLVVLALIGGLVAVLIQRIREIDKEDKDDYSQY